jgi:peptidoglycan-N-acetylglucosamine deacetylase
MKYPVYDHGNRTQTRIALTFDDGPNPSRTDQVLDILAHHNVRATFFVIGEWAMRFPDTLRRTIDAGHVIGNHTFSHTFSSDYELAEEIIQKAVGKPSVFFREPRLAFDISWQSRLAISDTTKLVSADVQVLDWLQTDQNELARLILESPDLKNGSIVLLHDGSHLEQERLDRPLPVIGALPEVISQLKMRGFEFAGLDQMELVDPVLYDSP